MVYRTDEITELEYLLNEQFKDLSKKNFEHFVRYVKPEYQLKWFHKIICSYLEQLARGEIKKLMIFVPPQHGKSELSSRLFPAYILGQDPKAKIAVTSYAKTLTDGFNSDCQEIIDSTEYKELFPETRLLTIGEDGKAKRTSDLFQTVGYKGYYKAVGIGGGLTGFTVDIGIIDDPFKDRKEANSELQRGRVWDWYNDVFKTRLHNNSKMLMLFTRWHEDDLAGRILDKNNPHYDEQEAKEWTVIALPALKEKQDNPFNTVHLSDEREIDDALWEEKHSAKKFIARRRINPTSFASLDQQRPALESGNKIKGEWFGIVKEGQLPFNPDYQRTDFFIDGAYTEKTVNDETAILACTFFRGKLYVYNCIGVRKELYEFLQFFPNYAKQNFWSESSEVQIELKASGYPLLSMLSSYDYGNYNCLGIPNKTVKLGKLNRVENIEPFLASGKVILLSGGWNEAFIHQCKSFPNGLHDDMVDVLCYAVHEYFITGNQEITTDEDIENLDIF